MFIGREKELTELREQFASNNRSVILVYGKRRVGKTCLIQEALREYDGVIVNHLCIKSSYEGNLRLLCRSVALSLGLSSTLSFSTIFDLFDFIKAQNKDMVIILDEYQYFKESGKDLEVDSYIQAVADSLPANVKLVLCGSYITIMKELLRESDPLFGRFTKIIHLEEFDYLDASRFCPELPVREKIRFYSVFGGSPYVLTNLDFGKSVEQNIIDLMLEPNSILRSYIENIALREIQKAFDIRILEVIGNSRKRFNEICSLIGFEDSSLLDKQLKNLLNMETITKVVPINAQNDRKKQFYEISDNLMRFYFTYVFSFDSLIYKFGPEEFLRNAISGTLNTFISYRFEKIANQYLIRQAHDGKLEGVLDFGTFWYDDKKNRRNGQFDCVLKRSDGYDFYEVKFFESPMTLKECEEEERQVRSIVDLACNRIGFICSAGFNFTNDRYDLIEGRDLY
jgi:AAA+ ATPase superfamily predicted ATPase